MKKPIMQERPFDLDLKKVLQHYFKEVDETGYNTADDDFEHCVFEEVMMAYYGRDVFDYLNKKDSEETE